MKFATRNHVNDIIADQNLLYDGELLPGTFMIRVPIINDIDIRTGIVIAITEASNVVIMWSTWRMLPLGTSNRGEFLHKLRHMIDQRKMMIREYNKVPFSPARTKHRKFLELIESKVKS